VILEWSRRSLACAFLYLASCTRHSSANRCMACPHTVSLILNKGFLFNINFVPVHRSVFPQHGRASSRLIVALLVVVPKIRCRPQLCLWSPLASARSISGLVWPQIGRQTKAYIKNEPKLLWLWAISMNELQAAATQCRGRGLASAPCGYG
jgi:hypothetical protein